jgi:hypothetical protein
MLSVSAALRCECGRSMGPVCILEVLFASHHCHACPTWRCNCQWVTYDFEGQLRKTDALTLRIGACMAATSGIRGDEAFHIPP